MEKHRKHLPGITPSPSPAQLSAKTDALSRTFPPGGKEIRRPLQPLSAQRHPKLSPPRTAAVFADTDLTPANQAAWNPPCCASLEKQPLLCPPKGAVAVLPALRAVATAFPRARASTSPLPPTRNSFLQPPPIHSPNLHQFIPQTPTKQVHTCPSP